jgi:hypothetical protein
VQLYEGVMGYRARCLRARQVHPGWGREMESDQKRDYAVPSAGTRSESDDNTSSRPLLGSWKLSAAG